MRKILLSRGMFALVDDEDFYEINGLRWCAHRNHGLWNACHEIRVSRGFRFNLYMHRVVLNAPMDMEVDHINHDGLDNRKCNLRLCTRSQNCSNARLLSRSTSGYKGVTWKKANKAWCAQICHKLQKIHIGLFDDAKEAARAYDVTALNLYGDFACINFSREDYL